MWKVRSELSEKETIFPIYSNGISYLCSSTIDYHLQNCTDGCTILCMNYKPYTCNYGGQENENDPEGEGQVMIGLETLVMMTWKHWTWLHEYWHDKEISLATDILQIQCHNLLFLLVPSYNSFLKNYIFLYFLRSGSSGWVSTDDLQVLWPADLSYLTQLQI